MARIELGGEVDNNISLFKRYFISKLKFLNAFKSMANYSITATYTLYTNQTISKCRNASINSKKLARITNTYLTNVSAPRYGLIDSGRTSTVQYTATLHFDTVSYNNSTLYTEFYYDD